MEHLEMNANEIISFRALLETKLSLCLELLNPQEYFHGSTDLRFTCQGVRELWTKSKITKLYLY